MSYICRLRAVLQAAFRGRSEKRALIIGLTVLLLHLLEWQSQPGLRGASWRATIQIQRISLETRLTDNRSLKSLLPAAMVQACRLARIEAERETGLSADNFPAAARWRSEQMMTENFWPGDA